MRLRPLIAGALFLALLPQTGCIGSFALTNKVMDFNRGLGSIVIQEVVFVAFLIVPVYWATLVIDGVVLNTIESLTGSNPLGLNEVREVPIGEGTVLRLERTESAIMSELRIDGQAAVIRSFSAGRDRMDVRDETGRVLISAERDVVGGIELKDTHGTVFASFTPDQVDAVQRAVDQRDTRALVALTGGVAVADAQ